MRLGVYYTSPSNPWGGTYTIKEDLFQGLVTAIGPSGGRLVVFTDDRTARERFGSDGVEWVTVAGARRKAWVALVKRRVNRVCSHGLLLPAIFSSESWLDPYLFAAGVDLLINFGPETASMSVPYVCAVFDLQHRFQPYMPEASAKGYWERWDEQYRQLLGRATFVIAGTRVGRREIQRWYQVPSERIVLLPHPTPVFALAAAAKTVARPPYLDRTRPFILYPAQFWAHKNHVTLLEALKQVREGFKLDLSLVLVGSDQGNLAFVKRKVAELGLADVVLIRGFVPRDELVALYQHALAMTYVSTCGPENLPPLEAFALGCPVIATDVPGAREQLADAAVLVSPTHPEEIAQAIRELSDQPSRRAELVTRGKARAAQHTAVDFARGLLDAVRSFEQKRKNWSATEPYDRPHRLGRVFGR